MTSVLYGAFTKLAAATQPSDDMSQREDDLPTNEQPEF